MHVHAEGGAPKPDELICNMEKAGVYGGTVISVRPTESYGRCKMEYEERIQNVLGWTKGYENRLFPVLWVHPREKDIESKIQDAAQRGISAFKMICDNYYLHEDFSLKAIETVAKTGKPLMFHTGILWIGNAVAGEYNKPIHWENMINVSKVKFSMAHVSWPWYDECIALFGRMKAVERFDPENAPEIYLDLTPGSPKLYREDLLNKLFNIYNTSDRIMFGADMSADDYDWEYTKDWIDFDNAIYDKLGIGDDIRENIYQNNFLKFIGTK